MLTYHISHEKIFSTALYVHGRSGVISKSNSFGAIAYVERRVVAYPGQEAILSIASPIQLSGDVLFTPMASFQHLMLPSALYSTTESTVNVPCTNLSTKCCRLNRGTAIGYFEKVSTDIDTKCSYVRAIGSKKTKNTHIIDMANMAKKDLPPSGAKRLDALLEDYSDIFSKHDFDLGCFSGVEHRIHTGEATPIRQPMRRTPIKFQQEEEKHLEKMLKAGVIEPSSSEWCQPPVLVRKKDSGVRWCIDYRALNNVTMKDAFPLPLIEECFDALQGMKYMSSLDLSSGYWQLSVAKEDRPKTAFITRYGLFQHTRMGFGLCNAPATFQRAMQHVLRGLQWSKVLVYIDDVIVLGKDIDSHFENLRCVFQRFREHNLKFKPAKCKLLQKEVKFLGWCVGPDGIAIPPENIQALVERPSPRNVREVQSFLGFINYHRGHLKDCAQLTAPLHQLAGSKGKKPFVWDDSHQEAFVNLKALMTSAPVMRIPDRTGLFILDTDASDTAIGSELSQVQNGTEYITAYGSYVLQPAQRVYCTTRKELLAIVKFTRLFRHYLLGGKFLVRTDHSSLAWLMRFKNAEGQLARWLEELSQYDMTIIHRPGRLHSNADFLSRPIVDCDCYTAGSKLEQLPCKGCKYCTRATKDWAQFGEDVDNVMPLAFKDGPTRTKPHSGIVRMVTGTIRSKEAPNWCETFTSTEVEKLQSQDTELQILCSWLTHGVNPTQHELAISSSTCKYYWTHRVHFVMQDGIIYRKGAEDSSARYLLLVPYSMRDMVLDACHGHITAGHLSEDKTLALLRRQF